MAFGPPVTDIAPTIRVSVGSDKDSLQPPPSPYPTHVDPSPVESHASTSTEATEIEDDGESNEEPDEDPRSPDIEIMSPAVSIGNDSIPGSRNSNVPRSFSPTVASSVCAPNTIYDECADVE